MSPFDTPLRYQLYDLVTSKYLGAIPLNQVSFSSQLNSPGSFSGQIDISSEAVQNLGPLSMTAPARTALFVDYAGALVWGGVIWPRNYNFDNTTRILTVNATELWSWVAQRVQATDYSSPPYSNLTGPTTPMPIWGAASDMTDSEWDSMLITFQLLSDALGLTYGQILGGMGIAVNSYTSAAAYLASGTNTPVANYINLTAPYTSLQTLGTLISQIAGNGLGVGFDFGVDVAYSGSPGSAVVSTINLSYPRRGRPYSQSGIVLNCGGAATTYTPPEDGTQAGNVIYEQGASGSLVIAQNIDALQQGYPYLEKIISRSNITSSNVLALLTNLGLSDLFLYSYPVVTPSVTLPLFGSDPLFGSFITGDDVLWSIPQTDSLGNVFDPRFPEGLSQEWRIQQWNANVPDEGLATMQIVLNQPPAVSATGPAI